MAEAVAALAISRAAVAAFAVVSAEREVAPELKALRLRVLAAASSVEALGPAFEARDARAAPLLATLEEAATWIERRVGKLGTQSWLHRATMSAATKAEIERLDDALTKCASIGGEHACAMARARTRA